LTSDRRVTGAGPSAAARQRLRGLSPRGELTTVLIIGAAGAGMVFLAMRPGWAQVRTAVPPPLPASVVTVSGQSLVPYAGALAIAALASLAATLATRRLLRRVLGVLLVALGVAIALSAGLGVSVAAARAAATGNGGVAPAAGTNAGSVTEGGSQAGSAVPNVAGFHSRVVLTAVTWQAVAILGALAIIAAGALVTWRANRLPVMSGRYDSPTGQPARPWTEPRSAAVGGGDVGGAGIDSAGRHVVGLTGAGSDSAGSDSAGLAGSDAGSGATASAADSAGMWEALSRGEDPTSPRASRG
jgi:Tryptophan-associated transmembrane protein (Trp_oprn_chp)